jgi:hypothetical protein
MAPDERGELLGCAARSETVTLSVYTLPSALPSAVLRVTCFSRVFELSPRAL